MVQALVYLVETVKVKVQILATVNGWDWKVEDQSGEFGQREDVSLIIQTHRSM